MAPSQKHQPEIFSVNGFDVHVLRRPRKRTIALTMQLTGALRVSASTTTPLSQIRDFVLQHADWIEKHSESYKKIRTNFPRKEYRDGEEFLFLGEATVLKFREGSSARLKFLHRPHEFICEIPPARWAAFDPHCAHTDLAPLFKKFYEMAGRKVLAARVDHFSEQMNLRPRALSFRSQKTRWGSCSSKGRVSLNWRLSFASPEVIDYVVVHELAHLQHYNHSKAFWTLVESYVPDYLRRRAWLRRHQYDADFLGRKSELYSADS